MAIKKRTLFTGTASETFAIPIHKVKASTKVLLTYYIIQEYTKIV